MTRADLQKAISKASESGLGAVGGKAFKWTEAGWKVRPGCLSEYYSSGERVVCGILICLYLELYGSRWVDIPPGAKYDNHQVDLVWPGGYYFLKALDNLTDETSWAAIKMLLPG